MEGGFTAGGSARVQLSQGASCSYAVITGSLLAYRGPLT